MFNRRWGQALLVAATGSALLLVQPAVTVLATGTPPGPPMSAQAQPGNGSATVTWTAPASVGTGITSYTVTASTGPKASVTGTPPATSLVFPSLTNGVSYTFTVHATNASGSSTESAPTAAITAGTPVAPQQPRYAAASGGASIDWNAVAPNVGTVTSYHVTTNPVTATVVVAGTATHASVTGLTNGTRYAYQVQAFNSVGGGPLSPATAGYRAGAPSPPASLTLTSGNASISAAWTASAPNASAVTSYRATITPGSTVFVIPAGQPMQATFGSLSNGTTYTIRVTANNQYGTSLPNGNTVKAGLPGQPGSVTASGGAGGKATVTWTAAPANGSPITSYVVNDGSSDRTVSGPNPPTMLVINGLTDGTTYVFRVTARNASGSGPISAPSTRMVNIRVSNFQYTPQATPVHTGERVYWYVDSGTHTVTSTAGQTFNSGTLATGAVFSITVTATSGTISYQCQFHAVSAGMTGTLTVTSGASAPAAVAAAPAVVAPVSPPSPGFRNGAGPATCCCCCGCGGTLRGRGARA